jgi:hypothetical protein
MCHNVWNVLFYLFSVMIYGGMIHPNIMIAYYLKNDIVERL